MFDPAKFELTTAHAAELAAVWGRMADEDKLGRCFPGGTMTAERFALQPWAWVYIGRYDGQPVGIAWLERFEERTARIGFCAFAAAGTRVLAIIAEAAARLADLRGADGRYCFNTLLGYIRSDNPSSARAARRAGFTLAGIIPDYFDGCDVEIYALQRSAQA